MNARGGLDTVRLAMRAMHRADEVSVLTALARDWAPDIVMRKAAARRAAGMVEAIRAQDNPGLMEVFLAEYGLSTDEGVALMCLAEALLRVPDAATMDDLIEDKIAPSSMGRTTLASSSSSAHQRLDLGLFCWRARFSIPTAAPAAWPGCCMACRQTHGRAGDPRRGHPRHQGNGPPVRSGRAPSRRRGAGTAPNRPKAQGYSLLLRHAGRGGADRSRCQAPISPIL